MALIKDTVVYVGEDLLWKLPDDEKNKFEAVERYKPDAINEQMNDCEARGEDWKDPFGPFESLDDYEDFWGGDWSGVGGYVYKRVYDIFTGKDEKYFQELALEAEGNELRIKYE